MQGLIPSQNNNTAQSLLPTPSSLMGRLPIPVWRRIFSLLSAKRRHATLLSCLMASTTAYDNGIDILYRHIYLSDPQAVKAFFKKDEALMYGKSMTNSLDPLTLSLGRLATSREHIETLHISEWPKKSDMTNSMLKVTQRIMRQLGITHLYPRLTIITLGVKATTALISQGEHHHATPLLRHLSTTSDRPRLHLCHQTSYIPHRKTPEHIYVDLWKASEQGEINFGLNQCDFSAISQHQLSYAPLAMIKGADCHVHYQQNDKITGDPARIATLIGGSLAIRLVTMGRESLPRSINIHFSARTTVEYRRDLMNLVTKGVEKGLNSAQKDRMVFDGTKDDVLGKVVWHWGKNRGLCECGTNW